MILGDPDTAATTQQLTQRGVAIDELLRRVAQRRPEAVALIDPPNRESFTDGEPRRLTYAQTERAVASIAARLRGMGLPADAVVGIQLPNTTENILALLGVMRARMIAAPLPLLWRRADAIVALGRIGAKALITCGRVGSFRHSQFALRLASEIFSIRYVCGFGQGLPDGIVPFDDLFTADAADRVPALERERRADAPAHVAVITFDVGPSGTVAVARNHLELLAGGLAVTLESRFLQNARILSGIAPSSFAGMSLTLMPWLLSSGTLSLHHPFDPAWLVRQMALDQCTTLIVPAPIALRLGAAGTYARAPVGTVIGAWRAPEQLPASPAWTERGASLVDVSILGEAGLVAGRRGVDGLPLPLPLGPLFAPRGSNTGILVAELATTQANTMALRGPMVPRHAFPSGIERSGLPHFAIEHSGLVDTGYACRVDAVAKAIVITGPPPGTVSVGGYRFRLHELQEAVRRIDSGAALAALPDPLTGQRLLGSAETRPVVEAALAAVGVNPLVAAAFGDRGEPRISNETMPPREAPHLR